MSKRDVLRAALAKSTSQRPKRQRPTRSCRNSTASSSSSSTAGTPQPTTTDPTVAVDRDNTETNEAIAELANLLLTDQKVLFITGAGLSVASGIKPFRGRDDAVWNESVREWGTRMKFLQDPLVWYNHFWLRHFDDSKKRDFVPNAGHVALARLARRYPDTVKIMTQNVDGLHSSGPIHVPPKQLIEVHGAGGTFKCVADECEYATTKTLSHQLNVVAPASDATAGVSANETRNDGSTGAEAASGDDSGSQHEAKPSSSTTEHINSRLEHHDDLPRCPDCNEVMPPNCLLFDEDYESHDSYQFDMAMEWIQHADVLVFVGTSYNVKITDLALNAANKATRRGTASKVVFDVNIEDLVPVSKTHRLVVRHATGEAERVLPQLCDAVLAVAGPHASA
jgi:NAD-dependent deacetylase